MAYSVLLVDPDPALAERIAAAAGRQRQAWQLRSAGSVVNARAVLQQQAFDVVALRHRLPDGTAFDLRDLTGDAERLIGIAPGEEVVAARAMRQGFADFYTYDEAQRHAIALPLQIARACQRRHDTVQRSSANAQLARQNALLQAISRAHSEFMTHDAPGAAFDTLLADFVALSHSVYGFLGEVFRDAAGQPVLQCYAVSGLTARQHSEVLPQSPQGMVFARLDTLFGSCMATGEPVIANRPAADPRSGGLPAGHPPLDAFLCLPAHAEGELVALVGLANRTGGYTTADIDFLAPLVTTVGQLVRARRAEAARSENAERLRDSEARWRNLTELSSDWYWELDEHLTLSRVEGNFARNWIVGERVRVGLHPWDLLATNLSDFQRRAYRQRLEAHETVHELELEFRNGDSDVHWVSVSAAPVYDADGRFRGYRGVGRDITPRRLAEARIEWLAFTDDLTALPNRRRLLDRLEEALADSTRLGRSGALLLLDLDNFKDVNDTLGPEHSDRLLQQVAARLRSSVRPHDTVARLGGDEFMVLLEGLPPEPEQAQRQVEQLVQAVQQTLGQPYAVDDADVVSTPSIGIVQFTDHLTPADELVKRADLAMYQAKAAGRNTYCFFAPAMQEAASGRLRLEADLRQALARDALSVAYQPVVGRDGRAIGVEALVRWQHPLRGPVSPAEFIPVAEQSGLIVPLGRHVLRTACRQLKAWSTGAHTRHLSIAVNVSAREFRHPQFVQQVIATLEQADADPRLLKLEITESLLVHDMQDTIAKMHLLRSRGIGLSLDDFGTGYSSLSYLKRLPFDQLKIDQSFVRGVLTDPHDAAIACSIIQLARSFGLVVVAEGVETEGQREYLQANGCECFQGWFFGRPVPVEQLVV
ncbi:EAL domain-containing protein [uncultured Xylophilus sp.]|uniref:EAL domain-containing protein n=1 Tax=uncultured Xylophilus sp. TaxID=296832 RepID=UPI0025F8FA21|nr:EAL domain-containing protein [uncultured Xylophilus sp.]